MVRVSAIPAPSGWHEIIRGLVSVRVAEEWKGKAWPTAVQGPEDSSAEMEMEGALKRAKPCPHGPDAELAEWRGWKQAIAAVGNCQGPELGGCLIEKSTERCSGDAIGSTDPSPRSFCRLGPLEESQK